MALLSTVVTTMFAMIFYLPSVASAQSNGPPGGVVPYLNNLPAEAKRNPLKRYQYFYQQRAFPNNNIPAGALGRARADHARQFGALRDASSSAAASTFNQNQWRPVGPFPIATSLTTSGRINSIAVAPANPSILYIGAATGGVWKSSDGGASWLSQTDTQCSTAMGSIAIDPFNSDIIYAATGENNFSADSFYGCGVLKSTNGGATWTQTGASVFDTASGGAKVGKIEVHPTVSSTLILATSFGVYRSLDSGASYVQVLPGIATDVVMNKTTPSIMYAAIGSIFGGASNGVYKSTDTGATWTKLAGAFPTASVGRISLAIANSAPSTVIAAVQSTATFGLLGVWRTTDAGANWAQQTATGASCASQCWYDMYVAIDPSDANIVYFGGFSLYRSVNGGAAYTDIGSAIHVDHHGFAFHPGTPTTIYSGNDGGIFKSVNSGTSWTSLNSNLSITQFSGEMGVHPTNAGAFLGGTQDNGTLLTSGTAAWTNVLGGDGGSAMFDQISPATAYGQTQWGGGFSGPRRSDNVGVTAFVQKLTGISLADSAQFYPAYVMSKADSQRLYFGTTKVYKTTNRGDTWTASATTLSGTVTAIAEAPSNSSIIYVGTSSGTVSKSSDGNLTYASATAGLPARVPSDLAVHPSDPNTAFVSMSGFGSGHVFKTTDGGAGWTNISGNLPDIPASSIVIHPSNPTTNIFVGTDLGVYRTLDGGVTWTPFTAGLPNAPVVDLVFNPNTNVLAASTHGRGVWVATIGGAASPVTRRDFDANGMSDILWRNSATGDVTTWLINGTALAGGGVPGSASSAWVIQGSGDFNGDGRSDVLWRNTTTGEVVVWFISSGTLLGSGSPGSASSDWVVQGAWDFNGDGRSDILWRNSTTGQTYIWTLNATATAVTGGGSPGGATSDWVITRAGDFNGDGRADLVWRNSASGEVYIWFIDGSTLIGSGSPGGASLDWVLEGSGDYNQDARSDVLWRNTTTGLVYIWLMNGASIIGGGSPGSATSDWVIQGVGDHNGDARTDILWRNSTTGNVLIWLMNGAALVGSGSPGSASSQWVIQRNKD